jgi:hypothetical protein
LVKLVTSDTARLIVALHVLRMPTSPAGPVTFPLFPLIADI